MRVQVSCVLGDPIPPPKWDSNKEPGSKVPDELINELHATLLKDMVQLFEKYKAAAGYPDAVLEIV